MGLNNYSCDLDLEKMEASFEGRRWAAYQDSKGIWTIGIGHTGPEVVEGLIWNDDEIDAAFAADNKTAQDCVNQVVSVPITQQENDALVDFVFNVGVRAFVTSTLLRFLNSGDFAGAAAEFNKWDHAGAQVLAGLLRRREAETAMFESGINPSGA